MKNIGLAGNPNSGKTTLFNRLTGLRQKTGNYPGVTTEIHIGQTYLQKQEATRIYDLPGAYSLYPNTSDEFELVKLILNESATQRLDLLVYVADITELDKQLLLLTQLMDLGLPCVMVLTMLDKVTSEEANALKAELQSFFGLDVYMDQSGGGRGMEELKSWLHQRVTTSPLRKEPFYQLSGEEIQLLNELPGYQRKEDDVYRRLLAYHHHGKSGIPQMMSPLSDELVRKRTGKQIAETMKRYESLQILEQSIKRVFSKPSESVSDKLDRIVTHPLVGPFIFLALMLFIFQAIYAWAEAPMDLIDGFFATLGGDVRGLLGDSVLSDFLVDGVLAGLGGILVFVPQIAILFFLLGIMEETGYMARAVFMFDNLMRRFGLSGKSMVSLMSAGACAIPAVMSTRSIENRKERLITILVSPFVSCSARIPVYTILIGLAVPSMTIFGLFNLKGLVFTSLYIVSILTALAAGFMLKLIFKRESSSELLIELPHYKLPHLKNVLLDMWNKTKAFVVEAGKIILIISMVLWFLGSYGPGESMENARQEALIEASNQNLDEGQTTSLVSSKQLEASFAGEIGKWMEPVIQPLGYDWKIGIALLASFAAREVFVGTMATIYSMEYQEDDKKLQDRLASEINPVTGQPLFNLATSLSLIVFFLFAMQCMSTLAIVKRETGTWKWPVIQFVAMSILAYISAFAVYQYLS